jgi:gamma-glutamyltranspeptidase / glutathione hydrolase
MQRRFLPPASPGEAIRMRRVLLLVGLLALLIAPVSPSATSSSGSPYSLSVQALLSGDGTDIYLSLSSDGAPMPREFEKVQLRSFSLDGLHEWTRNLFHVSAPGGAAVIPLAGLERGELLQVKAHVKIGEQNNVEAETHVRLRPDLRVSSVDAPARVVRKQRFTLTATVAEVAGDTGAAAVVSVFDGDTDLGARTIAVAPGGATAVPFSLQLPDARSHTLRVEISRADPAESDTSNNIARTSITVRMYDGDGVVVTEEWHATDVGAEILRQGGNAIDAAAAVQFALNVTLPHTNGIGGGSTILVHLASGQDFAIDARERAPAAATPTMFVGKTPLNLRNQSGCAVGVPGTLRALETMLDRWGTISLRRALGPATELAREGFPVGQYLALATTADRAAFQPETRAVFRQPDGTPLPVGYWLRQPDLARTFELIADKGASAFYGGEIAPVLVAAQTRTRSTGCQGTITLDDLAHYEIKLSKPIHVDYRGHDVVTAPPSSSGGLVLLQALELAERFPLGDASHGYGFGSGKTLNVDIEALRLALADRTIWMGDDDPQFGSPICVNGLLSSEYTASRSALIRDDARLPIASPGDPCPFETNERVGFDQGDEGHTTHFSIVDKWGNMVSFTTTLADGFGTGIMVPGYGFVLNDSLMNFNLTPVARPPSNPGTNDAAPNRRPMGSTAPVLIFDDAEPLVATGAPGFAWIPSTVFQVVSNVIDHAMPIEEAVSSPRFWINGPQAGIGWNPAFSADSMAYLRGLGQPLAPAPSYTPGFSTSPSLGVDPSTFALHGTSDPRSPDGSAVVLP